MVGFISIRLLLTALYFNCITSLVTGNQNGFVILMQGHAITNIFKSLNLSMILNSYLK